MDSNITELFFRYCLVPSQNSFFYRKFYDILCIVELFFSYLDNRAAIRR
jgi:hypothetical protein